MRESGWSSGAAGATPVRTEDPDSAYRPLTGGTHPTTRSNRPFCAEGLANLSHRLCIQAGRSQLIVRRRGDLWQTVEFFQQFLFANRSNPNDGIQFGSDQRFPAQLAVIGNREA